MWATKKDTNPINIKNNIYDRLMPAFQLHTKSVLQYKIFSGSCQGTIANFHIFSFLDFNFYYDKMDLYYRYAPGNRPAYKKPEVLF